MEGCPWACYQVRCTRVIDFSGGILPTSTYLMNCSVSGHGSSTSLCRKARSVAVQSNSRSLDSRPPDPKRVPQETRALTRDDNSNSKRRFLPVVALFWLAFLTVLSVAQNAQPSASGNETGKFRLHKFEQPIGEETYTITREGDTLTLKSDFLFTDRGTKVPLTATLRAAA